RNRNEATAVLALVNIIIPFHDGELLKRHTPVEPGPLLVELLLLLLQTTLLDFVGAELLEIIRETELLAGPDEPFGGIILVPLDGVAVIRWKLMVEIVISLTEG